MNALIVFFAGVGLTIAVSFIVLRYLKAYLQKILVDLCGTEQRANFWMAFCNVTLILVPLICAMHYRPELGQYAPVLLDLVDQIKWALVGLAASVLAIGLVISRFIAKDQMAKSQ